MTDEPDLERATRELADGFYHENIEAGLNGFWIEAKDLRVGDMFLGANGEFSVLLVTERVSFSNGITVYNFVVDGNHDYFVIARDDAFGQTCILVHNGECVTVTSWASEGIKPDLKPGRWVMLGKPTLWNFIKTGLWGPKATLLPPKLTRSNVPFTNSITGQVPKSSLQWPSGWEFIKGILGQRVIKIP